MDAVDKLIGKEFPGPSNEWLRKELRLRWRVHGASSIEALSLSVTFAERSLESLKAIARVAHEIEDAGK